MRQTDMPGLVRRNGAAAIVKVLADSGVDACFANPGTSEMQLVSALDHEPRIRPILCLFEGVATGAADGYSRMRNWPAATMLHLGPGYANGAANLHNAKRARSPVVNLIGDHATYHRHLDAPLNSDIATLAAPSSIWVRSATDASHGIQLITEAISASVGEPRGPASLILPADCAWSAAEPPVPSPGLKLHRPCVSKNVDAVAGALRSARRPVVLMGSAVCTEEGLRAAGRLHAAGIRIITDTFISRLPRGAGRFSPERLPYFGEQALEALAGSDVMVLASTSIPVSFFAYPGRPSVLVPDGCQIQVLSLVHEDGPASLIALADSLGAQSQAPHAERLMPMRPHGKLSPSSIGSSLARHMVKGSVVVDDAVTAGGAIFAETHAAVEHEWLMLTGGAIGFAIPAAIGAAVACPNQKVISLSGDGAAMYTAQGLWTLAREALDVVVIVFANRAYAILDIEFARTGSGAKGAASERLLSLSPPIIDWVSFAQSLGVPGVRCRTADEFDTALQAAIRDVGPRLIEADLSH